MTLKILEASRRRPSATWAKMKCGEGRAYGSGFFFVSEGGVDIPEMGQEII